MGQLRTTASIRRLSIAAAAAVAVFVASPQASAPADGGVVPGLSINSNYGMNVGSDVQSVAAGDSLTANQWWGFNVGNNSANSLSGVQLSIASAGSGNDYSASGWNFNYTFFPSDPNAFVSNNACPAASAATETCPDPAIALPPSSGEVTVFANTPQTAPTTPGFDAARSISGNAATVAVTLQDSRYAGGTSLAVRGTQDNADPSSTPVVTAGGQALPTCPQAAGVTCAYPSDFGSYQSGSAGCESVSMQIANAQVGTQYSFGWQEQEDSSSGCPTGEPGVNVVAWTTGDHATTYPCDSGTDCALTQPVTGLGDVTFSVGSGQGVTGYYLDAGQALYIVNFAPEDAPPPPSGTTSSAYGSSTSQSGTATATNAGTTAAATGQGGVTVSQYGSDPVTSPPFMASGNYFDVEILSGSNFQTLTIQNCDLMSGDSLEWWNGTSWLPVAPVVYPDADGCVTATLNNTDSSPLISQLGGTIFAVTEAPLLTVAKTTLRLLGVHIPIRLRCTRLACHGTATLERGRSKLGHARYAIAPGKTATVRIAVTRAGKKALAHIPRSRPYRARLFVTVAHSAAVTKAVQIRK